MSEDFESAEDLRAWVEQGYHEPSAAERVAARQQTLRATELERRLEDEIDEIELGVRRRRRRRRVAVIAWVVVFALIAGLLARSLVRSDPATSAVWSSGDVTQARSPVGARPEPSPESPTPLGRPPAAPLESGRYQFASFQEGSEEPVAYDPCRPIRYVVNDTDLPDGLDETVESAVRRVSAATGLQFVREGATGEATGIGRDAFQPDRYGDRWAPVLIWWSNPDATPELEGPVAGFGGSVGLEITGIAQRARSVYVSGSVVLDGPQIGEILRTDPEGEAAAEAVVLHELAHVVGLGHVDDPTQLMNPESVRGVTDFAAGDRRGLRELGMGECFPQI